ncbi:MAG TPA: cation transporter, partial [Bacillota bacterium]|nr:cation transporter [Bacillota bacterium]
MRDVKPDTYHAVRFVLWIILIANFAVAAAKILIGYWIKSNSLSADGIHSLTDGSSNIVGLIGIHFAFQPEDKEPPYGHKKFETLTGLFIAAMLVFLGFRS